MGDRQPVRIDGSACVVDAVAVLDPLVETSVDVRLVAFFVVAAVDQLVRSFVERVDFVFAAPADQRVFATTAEEKI